jgi:gluconate 2-dehydrogenase gamma chain
MGTSGSNRREFLFDMAGAATAAWLTSHGLELRAIAAHVVSAPADEPYEFFTPEQAREFDAISAQIVPTDETPGAREAHVVRFVDRYAATIGKAQQPGWQQAFKELGDAVAKKTPGNRSFAALSDAEQIAFLTELEQAHPWGLGGWRYFTMLGMFSDPIHGGNFNKVGWKMIGFDDRYSWTPPFGYYDSV